MPPRGAATPIEEPAVSEDPSISVTRTLPRLLVDRALFDGAPILVGHSLGGLIAWRTAQEYPSEISGVILLDPSPPEGLPVAMEAVGGVAYRLSAWLAAIGWTRWRYYRANPELTRDQQLRFGQLYASGARARESLRELLGAVASPVPQRPEGPGTLPLTVVVAPTFAPPGFGGAAKALDGAKRRMADASSRSRLLEAGTSHYIHLDEPDTVTAEVLDMLRRLR
jgi:pimeloyl-ACP methyl ester carboxylesterase